MPEIYAAASPETVVLLCTALSGGSLQGRLEEACAAYGAQRLALDLERLMMDFPLPCPSGEGIRLSREELAIRMQYIANEMRFYELVIFLEEHRSEYVHFILTGETSQ